MRLAVELSNGVDKEGRNCPPRSALLTSEKFFCLHRGVFFHSPVLLIREIRLFSACDELDKNFSWPRAKKR